MNQLGLTDKDPFKIFNAYKSERAIPLFVLTEIVIWPDKETRVTIITLFFGAFILEKRRLNSHSCFRPLKRVFTLSVYPSHPIDVAHQGIKH